MREIPTARMQVPSAAMMMRVVVVATALSIVASLATSAIYVKMQLEEVEGRALDASTRAIEARGDALNALKTAGDIGAAVAMRPAVDPVAEDAMKQIRLMREELDAMQTQIRLLKLGAR